MASQEASLSEGELHTRRRFIVDREVKERFAAASSTVVAVVPFAFSFVAPATRA